jgi:hypothetical protein
MRMSEITTPGVAVPVLSKQFSQDKSFPVENFQAYTSPFGYRSRIEGGGTEFHRGLDMAAPEGSYIRSWGGGTVSLSDDTAAGTAVVVKGGDWEAIYGHGEGRVAVINGVKTLVVDDDNDLKTPDTPFMVDHDHNPNTPPVPLTEGLTIAAGVRIGRVGMTGRTTGPHLHWGLKYQNQWVDPALVLRAMYAEQPASPSRTSSIKVLEPQDISTGGIFLSDSASCKKCFPDEVQS